MAWSSAELSSDEQTYAAADKPILGANAAAGELVASRWTATDSGTFSSTDITDSDKPISRLFDGLPGLQTTPDSVQTDYTICLQFDAPGIEFDGILYLNHGLYTNGVTSLKLQIADDSTFSSNLQTLSDINPSAKSSDARLADLSLYHTGTTARRYSDVIYARITLTRGINFTPSIGQIVFLRRRQLKHQPDRPWDPTDQHSNIESYEALDGTIYSTVRYRGRREIRATLPYLDSTRQGDVLSWWSDIEQGSYPFVWIDSPGTAPSEWWLMRLSDAVLSLPYSTGGQYRDLEIEATEQGPSFMAME